MPWVASDPKQRRTPGDAATPSEKPAARQNALHPWHCGSRSRCPGSPSITTATVGSTRLGACGLLAGPARRRSDQQWQRG